MVPNALTTYTNGIDLVATWIKDWSGGLTTLSAAANWNKTEITRRTPRANGFWLRDVDVYNIENGSPRPRANVSLRHTWSNAIMLFIRGNWYGNYTFQDNSSDRLQEFGSVLQVDASLGWDLQDGRYNLTFGGNNIFNQYPDQIEFGVCCGALYRRESVMDWQGRFYYARASYRWN